uniref:Membrane metalloendopeptidase like 1 n=1 Tax=Salmo trutta TaxID=8032 RepID=A0A674BEZ8_SALTR
MICQRNLQSLDAAANKFLLSARNDNSIYFLMFSGQKYRSGPSNVCTTPECVTAAARLLQNMDATVEPCQNFYQYACGGWLERHVIPETSSRHSVFDILRDRLEIVLKGQTCVANSVVLSSVALIEQRDSQPLMLLIDSIGDWPAASEDWNSTAGTDTHTDTLATLISRYHKKVLLDMYVWTDDRDSRRHIIYVRTVFEYAMSQKFSACFFYEIFPHSDWVVRKLTSLFLFYRLTNDRVVEEMLQVLELETDIANVSASLPQQELELFVRGVLSSVAVKVQLEEEVVVYSSPYLEKMNKVLSKHTVRTMQNYLTWQVVMERVSSLSRRFKDARAHYRKALYGTTVEEARWRDCVRYVQGSMENAVGALYVRETFAGESKRMVSDLISKIQEAYVETLEELSWMDDQSKEKAREKAMAIKEHIGYPDHILEESNLKLDQEYAHLNFSEENYFENILENLQAEAHKSLKKLREPVNPDMWIIGAAVVNAFYSPNRNQIVFPAGILQPPFFSKQQLQALNFGGIGMVIGHEITHGFDDNGRNFDKDGNMLNWWSNYSAEHFKDQSQCMVQQYGNFNWKLAGGQNVSGISTLGENIADNGGVRQAYKAYMKWMEREGEEHRLPGLDMDHKQLFFLNFAQVWCGAYRPEYASQSIKTDSHSPLEYRVLGSLQNFGAFSEAFQCKPGTPMNPEIKCRVW